MHLEYKLATLRKEELVQHITDSSKLKLLKKDHMFSCLHLNSYLCTRLADASLFIHLQ